MEPMTWMLTGVAIAVTAVAIAWVIRPGPKDRLPRLPMKDPTRSGWNADRIVPLVDRRGEIAGYSYHEVDDGDSSNEDEVKQHPSSLR